MTALTTPELAKLDPVSTVNAPRQVRASGMAVVGSIPIGEAFANRHGLVARDPAIEDSWAVHDWNGPEWFVLAVDAAKTVEVVQSIAARRTGPLRILQLSRGLDPSGATLGEAVASQLGSRLATYAVLAGGLSAQDLRSMTPTQATLACRDAEALAALGELLVDCDLHLRRDLDVRAVEWSAAFAEVMALLLGLTEGAELPTGTRAWTLRAASDEIVAMSEREQVLEMAAFGGHQGPWAIELPSAMLHETPSRRLGRLLGRGFTLDDAVVHLVEGDTVYGQRSRIRTDVPALATLRGAMSRGITSMCPGLAALADFAANASSTRELWERLLHRSIEMPRQANANEGGPAS
ncbi:MAG: hypothetical protein H6832_05305 [Planctomycetes bacterium]|nr:hypothetical protein [Planctomycetota bacterium]